VIDARFWDKERGLLREEYARDWSPVSEYRGMNANMHGAEATLAAFEATGEGVWLEQAGRILDFFAGVARTRGWRLPEHYRADWSVDEGYAGDPMFRPAGTTPGHSLKMGRLLLQHWDLSGRRDAEVPGKARALIGRALANEWRPDGGLVYTLRHGGAVDVADRYWLPVAEGIDALAALIALERRGADEDGAAG
jgi:mannose/cellobiose epimerase-like protein (N-acyl-D-glucosamine 2-epimerase family)